MAEKDINERVRDTGDDESLDAGINPGMDAGMDDTAEELRQGGEGDQALEKSRAELQEAKDRYLRLAAEFENFKRRTAKERVELIQTAGREVIVEMLNVLDDCDRAQKQLETTDNIDQIREGVGLVFNKFRTLLLARGLKAMETIGKDFNADLHEAITEIPAPDEKMKGKVIDEVVRGYYLNDKIIRHAKVVVGK